MNLPIFRVIDCATGKEASLQAIEEALCSKDAKSHWAHGLIYCDLDEWFVGENGSLALSDDCGVVRYPPNGLYRVEFNVSQQEEN